MNEHYRLLEVDETSSHSDIKSKYRQLSKKYHPDISKDDGSLFKQLTISYDWLIKNHIPKIAKCKLEFNKKNNLFLFVKMSVKHATILIVNKKILEEGAIINCLDTTDPWKPEVRITVGKNTKDKSVYNIKHINNTYTFILREVK